MDNEKLFKKAINNWGVEAQIKMAIEECSELITVLVKHDRKFNGSSIVDVISEMVDVTIMMEQLRVIFSKHDDLFKSRYELKINRLEKMLNG